jgi:hypothetical protein
VRDDQTVVLGLVTKRSDMESAVELKRHGRHLQSSTSPGRFPELGRTFYEQGPGRTIAALATVFERLADRGVLQPDDPLLAAAHFNWLVMSSPLTGRCCSARMRPRLRRTQPVRDAGVRAFLAAYAQP